MGKENNVCTVEGFFFKDLLNVSLNQNFHRDSTCIVIIFSLIVRPGEQRSLTLESLHMVLGPSCVRALPLGQPTGPSRLTC